MKKGCLFAIAVGMFLLLSLCTPMWWPRATIVFHVMSDEGWPVAGAKVSMSTFGHWEPGEGFGRDIPRITSRTTDASGVVTLSSPSRDGHFYYRVEKDGYYSNVGDQYDFAESKWGCWQPADARVEVPVKRIIKPIAMYARNFMSSHLLQLPTKDGPVGFDLVAADWVQPYGRGRVPDFIFEHVLSGSQASVRKMTVRTIDLTLRGAGNGIQPFSVSPSAGSGLRSPRFAPEEGYVSEIPPVSDFAGEDRNYFFRVRAVLNGKGEITSAFYGKIYGEVSGSSDGTIQLQYYLNPTPNDRNMEFDRRKNLFGELPGAQEVRDP